MLKRGECSALALTTRRAVDHLDFWTLGSHPAVITPGADWFGDTPRVENKTLGFTIADEYTAVY